ncbi:MAG: hypothetical protein HOK52_10745 [Candidatus Marinimicrobia bacterium]|jgi:hypothetical protein|nr:hypothetical protein [Candidatus Neomarinimicrobiota bacterium]MBT3936460.1 hypothetical protein [Candidatus Neomarinimicrobiota bacterium]MBT3962425.1 hypothetical protein [Candidatus Neomarinimicrobiota bacterium]MBT4383850.1 hypothetical protein [Candidatus Neomarinimicrobiota bacterium]MBT4636357.1 hypothetical protein [Candidatus Neomarinimicrobiota bacterium]|tara:strand:- start:748 stop:1068 length:321 start_codon:yes stop_codon:yes gene_type:complete
MNQKLDKIISILFLIGSLVIVGWWIYSAYVDGIFSVWILQLNSNSQSWVDMLKSNWRIIVPVYLFICFQAAGISEIKKNQNYLHAVIISIFFTPISLFFINGENDK